MIHERDQCHRNLKAELDINSSKTKPSKHQFRADSFIQLRACWQRGLSGISEKLEVNTAIEDFEPTEIYPLHSNTDFINSDLSKVREIGKDRVDKFVSVKITQSGGWRLQNPKFSEVLTVPRSVTKRQQKAALTNATKQAEVISELLLQSTAM